MSAALDERAQGALEERKRGFLEERPRGGFMSGGALQMVTVKSMLFAPMGTHNIVVLRVG